MVERHDVALCKNRTWRALINSSPPHRPFIAGAAFSVSERPFDFTFQRENIIMKIVKLGQSQTRSIRIVG